MQQQFQLAVPPADVGHLRRLRRPRRQQRGAFDLPGGAGLRSVRAGVCRQREARPDTVQRRLRLRPDDADGEDH